MAKQKIKTNKSAAKRFKKTGKGKFKRARAGKGHLLTCKSKKRKRNLRKSGTVHNAEQKKIDRMMPN